LSDEPKQTKDWTGEEKLRVVLEAMKTSVAQVCAKYAQHGLSEEQIQNWRQQMVERGGEVFEPKVAPQAPQTVRIKAPKQNPFLVFIATFSILFNCALAVLAAAVYFDLVDLSGWFGTGNSGGDASALPAKVSSSRPDYEALLASASEGLNPQGNSDPSAPPSRETPSRPPVTAPIFGGPQPPQGAEMVSEVEVCGVLGQGNKVVFVLDLNQYMRTAPDGEKNFERLLMEVRDGVQSLGAKTAFNVILLDGISRLHMLEKTLVEASGFNKRAAYSWLSFPSWDVPGGVKTRFGETDLGLKLPDGVVGPWRALSAALAFDPDLIYLVTGDCSSLRPDEFSVSELSGVQVSSAVRSTVWERWRRETDAVRLTVAKWLQSDTLRSSDIAVSDAEIDVAIRKLGIPMPAKPLGSPDSRWPWASIYQKFSRSLMRSIPDLADTHMVVVLPKGRALPVDLEGKSKEFAQLSGGSYTILDEESLSSPR
tara:strand:+ start:1169 stop:2611 length:1443 start_codon:yes stop_codon:yes gene_type:complete